MLFGKWKNQVFHALIFMDKTIIEGHSYLVIAKWK